MVSMEGKNRAMCFANVKSLFKPEPDLRSSGLLYSLFPSIPPLQNFQCLLPSSDLLFLPLPLVLSPDSDPCCSVERGNVKLSVSKPWSQLCCYKLNNWGHLAQWFQHFTLRQIHLRIFSFKPELMASFQDL